MSITFRVASIDDQLPVAPATISIRQMVAFRDFARTNNIQTEGVGDGVDISISMMLDFEASICSIALAVLARIFDYADDVITVLDEAQFTWRQIRFYKAGDTGEVMLTVVKTIDSAISFA